MRDYADQHRLLYERNGIMGDIASYILSVVCAAVVCGIIGILFDGKTAISGVINLVLGIVMTVIILKPILFTEPIKLDAYWNSLQHGRESTLTEGIAYAKFYQSEFIKEKVESYIIEKTNSLGADAVVEVLLNDENMPVAAKFSGTILPYTKVQLEDYLQTNFGIQKECVTWS